MGGQAWSVVKLQDPLYTKGGAGKHRKTIYCMPLRATIVGASNFKWLILQPPSTKLVELLRDTGPASKTKSRKPTWKQTMRLLMFVLKTMEELLRPPYWIAATHSRVDFQLKISDSNEFWPQFIIALAGKGSDRTQGLNHECVPPSVSPWVSKSW